MLRFQYHKTVMVIHVNGGDVKADQVGMSLLMET